MLLLLLQLLQLLLLLLVMAVRAEVENVKRRLERLLPSEHHRWWHGCRFAN